MADETKLFLGGKRKVKKSGSKKSKKTTRKGKKSTKKH